MTHRILILGGTTQARELAARLAMRPDAETTLSLAGRTAHPADQPVPVRTGGFGGIAGLAAHLRDNAVDVLVDATHPHASRISANAVAAARLAGTVLVALRRAAWSAVEGDRWIDVDDATAAVAALGPAPRAVFLALGRGEIAAFEAAPQHRYLVRSVDPIEPPLSVPRATYVVARGPFAEQADEALLARHGIDAVVAKNSGGAATYGKIAAARRLGIDVLLLRRPAPPDGPSAGSVEEALAMVDHALASPAAGRKDRGV